ncbi:MAG: hypothetical protein ACLSIL_06615 [Enterococcus casseliflavus]
MPDQGKHKDLQATLVQALDQQMNVALPAPEKAALFLLSLDERQFLNPFMQKTFIQAFSPTKEPYLLVRETEGLTYRLFDMLLFLMETFFQLPLLEAEVPETHKKDALLAALMTHFSAQKKLYSETIVLSYDLVGPSALKRWIKTEVEVAGKERGLHFADASLVNRPGIPRHIKITNQNQKMRSTGDIELPQFPTKEAIRCILSDYF